MVSVVSCIFVVVVHDSIKLFWTNSLHFYIGPRNCLFHDTGHWLNLISRDHTCITHPFFAGPSLMYLVEHLISSPLPSHICFLCWYDSPACMLVLIFGGTHKALVLVSSPAGLNVPLINNLKKCYSMKRVAQQKVKLHWHLLLCKHQLLGNDKHYWYPKCMY